MKEFIALAKRDGGKLTYGSAGTGTGPHMAMELFLNVANIRIQHVPYRGVSQSVTDILGDRLSGMMLNMLTAKPHVDAGKLRMLGAHQPGALGGDAGRSDHRGVRVSRLRGAAMVRPARPRRHPGADPQQAPGADRWKP